MPGAALLHCPGPLLAARGRCSLPGVYAGPTACDERRPCLCLPGAAGALTGLFLLTRPGPHDPKQLRVWGWHCLPPGPAPQPGLSPCGAGCAGRGGVALLLEAVGREQVGEAGGKGAHALNDPSQLGLCLPHYRPKLTAATKGS